jgi:hypothetical protein
MFQKLHLSPKKESKSCILFACTILSEDRLHVLTEFIEQFQLNFSDSDLFIGINPGSIPVVEELILDSGLRIKAMSRVSEELYTESDASAYQLALNLLKQSGDRYEYCWFVHTKGGVNSHSDYLRKWYIDNFLEDRFRIENLMRDFPNIGSYAMLGVEFDCNRTYSEQDELLPIFSKEVTKDFPFPFIEYFYIHTLYVIKGNIMENFFSILPQEWFNTKLNRYYFEGVFPFLVSRTGYLPFLSNTRSMNGVDLKAVQSSWILNNNLISYDEILNVPTQDYHFHQLNPPYVSSNT